MPLLRKQGGSIVNLSSVLGLVGSASMAAYSASKGGVSLLTKSVALHGARMTPPVRCNAICPAFIDGAMVDEIASGARDPKAARERFPDDIPLARLGKPEEVASLCVYLLSDASAFITGADVAIDGGLTARSPLFLPRTRMRSLSPLGRGGLNQSMDFNPSPGSLCDPTSPYGRGEESYPRISAVTCAAAERASPCKS
jgi:hypothetical protein